MKLLLADDDRDQLELRGMTLARAGYEICTAWDEAGALKVAAEQRPDIAVVDLRMPTEAVGLRLIHGLKQLDSGLRLIVLTGVDAKKFEALPERALVEAVLTKGSGSKRLLAHLRSPRAPVT